jgi:hypothetical protein
MMCLELGLELKCGVKWKGLDPQQGYCGRGNEYFNGRAKRSHSLAVRNSHDTMFALVRISPSPMRSESVSFPVPARQLLSCRVADGENPGSEIRFSGTGTRT